MQVFAATSLAAVGAPQGVSLEQLVLQWAVRVTWSPPTDLCGLTNPQYTIQYGKTTSTPTTHSSMPSSSPLVITGLAVGQEYYIRVAVRGNGTFSSWEPVTPCKGVRVYTAPACVTVCSNTEYTEYIIMQNLPSCLQPVLAFGPHFSCCSGCLNHGLIGAAYPRSSQGHLVSFNWPVWTDQPTVHHSVWEEHFYSHHTLQHAFLFTVRHHRPGRGTAVLCKGSRSYTKWKW